MSKAEGAKVKLSFWETSRTAWNPYRRLYSYAGPYKWRFALGIAFGSPYGVVTSFFPLTSYQGRRTLSFHGAAPNPKSGTRSSRDVKCRTEDRFDRLDLSRHSGGDDRPKSLLLRKRLLHELGQQQSSERHSEPAFHQSHAALDGFLQSNASRIPHVANPNDTRNMQQALASVSSDVFKQPITIVGAVTVLLLMDWKFTVVGLVLVSDLHPANPIFRQTRARSSPTRAKRRRADVGDDAGKLRRHPGDQVLRARGTTGENIPSRRAAIVFSNHADRESAPKPWDRSLKSSPRSASVWRFGMFTLPI